MSLFGISQNEMIQRLYRQAYRYQFGAEQDMNPAIKFLHNSYAKAYIDAIRDLFMDAEIQSAIGKKYWDLQKRIHKTQDELQAMGEKLYAELRTRGLI